MGRDARSAGSRRDPERWGILAAGLIAVLIHIGSLGGAFVYDDTYEIRDNPQIRTLSFVIGAFGGEAWEAERGYGFTYRPVSWAAATLLYAAGGGSPVPFHAFNLLLHGFNTVLVGLLLGALLREAGGVPGEAGLPGAPAIAALLFAVHPVHVEAVAWASGRSDLMAAALLLLSWFVLLRGGGSHLAALLGGVLYLGALFSKESAVAGLLIIPLSALSVGLFRRGSIAAAARGIPWGRFAVLLAAFAVYLAARVAALGQIGRGVVRGPVLLNPLEGAGMAARVMTAIALVPQHIRLLLWPDRLSLDYGFDQIPLAASPLDPRVLLILLGGGALIAARWIGRSTFARGALAVAALYAAAGLPTSNLLSLPASIFSERYLYLPSAVFTAGAALLLSRGIAAWRVPLAIALAAFAVAGSMRSLERCREWRDAESLYRSSLEAAPRAVRLHYNLGVVLRDQGRHVEAEASFRRALDIAPAYADARAERGLALMMLGRLEEASEDLRRAAEDAPADPVILNNLGAAYLGLGRPAEAIPLFRRALEVDPRSAEALGNLGKGLLQAGDLDGARRAFGEAIAADPDDASSLVGFGAVLAASGDFGAAVATFRRALQIQPDDEEAAFNLALALIQAGDPASAVPVLERLASRNPGDAEVASWLDRARQAGPLQ